MPKSKIKIDNLRLRVNVLNFDDVLVNSLKKRGIIYNYERVKYDTALWDQPANILVMRGNESRVNAGLFAFRLSTELNASGLPTAPKKKIAKSIYPSITNFNIYVNGEKLFEEDLSTANDFKLHLHEAMGNFLDWDDGSLITAANYSCANTMTTFANTPLFYIFIDFSKMGFNTGLDLRSDVIEVRSTAASATANLYLDYWLYHSVVADILEKIRW